MKPPTATVTLLSASLLWATLLWASWCGCAAAQPANLVPAPASDRVAAGHFSITAETEVDSAPDDQPARQAAQYFVDLLAKTGALVLPVRTVASTLPHSIRFVTEGQTATRPQGAYHLQIDPDSITISAADSDGLFYGGMTLWQLLTERPGPAAHSVQVQVIDDQPRFPWRGVMIDSARHFQTVAYIEQFLDWMAIHKLNVLHWHLTDDQGWRIEIKHYPKLTAIGAWRVPAGTAAAADIDSATGRPRLYGGFYSQQQIRDIVAYAALRHISIVPEIDMPGHATAAIAAYPELGVAPVAITAPSSDWGVLPNLLTVDEAGFDFIETVLGEVLDLFPGRYIHIGGDEAVKDQWKASAAVQARIKSLGLRDEEALQSYFVGRLDNFLEQHGRRLVGWDEILQGGISPHATVMSWRGIDGAVAAVKAGHDAILSPHPLLYFDNRQGPSSREPPGRGHIVTVQDVFGFDPMPVGLTAQEQSHLLGVQANLWTEHMRTEQQLTKMAFPRVAALAEIAWSPAAPKNWRRFSTRLAVERQRYQQLGLIDDALPAAGSDRRVFSQQLTLCSEKLSLSLEGDRPLIGDRPTFMVDLMNPCWIYKKADLAKPVTLTARVGQIPFNFQLGSDRDKIHLRPPQNATGELEIRADRCDGKRIAAIDLPVAPGADGLVTLTASLPRATGRHDLCFNFTGTTIDPLWVIDWLKFDSEKAEP